jgi:hypothetical protein
MFTSIEYRKVKKSFINDRFSKILENLEEILNLREKLGGLLDLIKLIYFVLCVSHFSACGWYLIGKEEAEYSDNSWIIKN